MANGAGEISIERSLNDIEGGIKKIRNESKQTEKDLKAVNEALRYDPENNNLLDRRNQLLQKQQKHLQDAQREHEVLKQKIEEINAVQGKSNELTEAQAKKISNSEIEIIKMGTAIQKQAQITQEAADKEAKLAEEAIKAEEALKAQAETTEAVKESTKSFSQSMTEFQSKLSAVKQVMSGLDNAFRLFGGDPDSAMGKAIKQGQQAINMMSGIASMGKLLTAENAFVAGSFNNIALAATAAVSAYAIGTGIIDLFGEENRKIAGVVAITTAAVGGLAIAGLAAAGALSWGTAIPAILAAVGLGAAGLTAILKKETKSLEDAKLEKISTSTPSLSSSLSNYSTPSVPSYSSSGSSQPQMIINTLSEQQIYDAIYSSAMRVVLETGLNEKEFIGSGKINDTEVVRLTFGKFLQENERRGKPLKTN